MDVFALRSVTRLTAITAVALSSVLVLSGCGGSEKAAIRMPDVVGSTLELAESDIARAGYTRSVEVVGGGMLGILDKANWEVCAQLPSAGEDVTGEPRLTVERSCVTEDATADQETADESDSDPLESLEPENPSAESSTPETSESETPTSSNVDAVAIEDKFVERLENNFIESIESMCDSGFTHWACFYDGSDGRGAYLQLSLTTDGGWSDDDIGLLADQAGRHWYNFIGCDFPDLETIVVKVNGVDHNVFRSSIPLSC